MTSFDSRHSGAGRNPEHALDGLQPTPAWRFLYCTGYVVPGLTRDPFLHSKLYPCKH